MINPIDPVDDWHLKRWGRFTASENYKLMVSPKPNKSWSDGSLTYIEEKAIQSISDMWERPEMEEVKSLLYGKAHEYPAFERYVKETKNYSVTYMGTDNPVFLYYEPLKEESGGTPDAANILSSGSIDFISEIKCPRNPVYHFRRLKWKDQWDLKENYILCYTQIQNLLLITGAQEGHFVSFDDRQHYTSKKIKIIPVKPDKSFQDQLDLKIRMAVKEKYVVLSEHLGVQVKSRADLLNIK